MNFPADSNQNNEELFSKSKHSKFHNMLMQLSKSRKVALIAVAVIAVIGAGWLVFGKAEPTRDITQQPFSRWSIWNMPIGSNADYGDGLPSGYMGGLVQSGTWTVATFIANSSDPTKTVNTSENGSVTLKVPSNASSSGDLDGATAIIQPDGNAVYEFYDFQGSNALLYSRVDLTGTGQGTGYPRASQNSLLGGLIRKSDWDKGQINHSLAISIDRGALSRCGFIWPAISEDDGSCGSGYSGSVPMGSMWAIPASVDIASLGLSKDGLMIAKALQNYGGYMVDSSDSGGPKLWGEYPSLDEGRLQDATNDMSKISQSMRMVKNSGPNTIGGGGNPRVCYASPIGNDNNIANPNGNVTEPQDCGSVVSPPPPPSPSEPCPANQVLINNECSTCPSETYIKDGKCVNANCSPAEDGSTCAPECPEDQVLFENKCRTGNCPEDTVNNNGVCTYCSSEKDYIKNGKCINPDCFVFNNSPNQASRLCDSGDPQVDEYKPAGTYDDDVAFYTRGWETVQNDTEKTYFKGSEHRTNGKTDNWPLAFKFKGNNIKIYGSKGPSNGRAKAIIDGASATGTDYYDSTDKNQELVYDSGELEDGNHLLKLTGIKYEGTITQEVRYISVDKIVVASSAVQEQRCPEGTTKQADGTCKLNDPSKDCPSGTIKQADGTCKIDGKGGVVTPDKKIDSDITKKPEAKTVAEKLVNTGRFLLLPAIVAVSIMLIASGLYVVTKKKRQ